MADGADNLVLEQLRLIRGDIANLDVRMTTIAQRLDSVENEVRGIGYVMTASLGSMPGDLKDIKERVGRLEKV
jgi:uncharacterized protein (UPF0335 family)